MMLGYFDEIANLFTMVMNIDNHGVARLVDFSRIRCSNGLSPTGTSAFGIMSVSGFRRVPSPAAKIIIFILMEL